MSEGMENSSINRRAVLGGIAGLSASGLMQGASDMPYRTLGRTGEKVSALGLGGSHVGKPSQLRAEETIRIIRSCVDRGMNFMDNSWDYNDGESELRMGRALRDGYREKVFLMTKI